MVGRTHRHRWALAHSLALAAALTLLVPQTGWAADTPRGCAPVARIVSIQGGVQILRAGASDWSYLRKLDAVVCQGDLLHADADSRAALLIEPETLIRLDQNTTLAVSQTPEETVVEFTQDTGLWKPLRMAPTPCGAGYVVTRFPRRFKVLTPFVNATVEGTEFLVAMRCESSEFAVLEGKVLAQEIAAGESRSYSVVGGEALAAGAEPTAVTLLVKPVDAVQWALYYPPLGEAAGAHESDTACDQAAAADRVPCLLRSAERGLRTGRVDAAQTAIEAALRLAPDSGDALALLAVIAVTKNDPARGLALARKATEVAPEQYRTWLALSYAQQADFRLEDALASAQDAASRAPRSTVALARIAELLMSLGRIGEATAAARALVSSDPAAPRPHTVLGFAYLAQFDTARAKDAFQEAIERDSADPLPRLGLGLAMIREGHLRAGREQIEIAVVLDPANALIRSYVGKAYYEENTGARDRLAASQFSLAKELDPNDPTPWFYQAILEQTQNAPVDALGQLQRSIELNDNRAVYRSRLLLDEDLAARNASLARVYDELDFRRLGVLQATRSLAFDPSNYAAHRFLSDVYLGEPRYEIGRLSELLQSQLWQPLNLRPLQPQLGETGLSIVPDAGPARLSYNEFNQLFVRDGLQLYADGLIGDNETWGDNLVVAGLAGRTSFSIGQFHYETQGYRPNNDQNRDLAEAFLQLAVSHATSVQVGVSSQHTRQGDLQLRGATDDFYPRDRSTENINRARLGLRHDFLPSSRVIGLLLYQDTQERSNLSRTVPDVGFSTQLETDAQVGQHGYLAELQHVGLWSRLQLTSGVSYFKSKTTLDSTIDSTVLAPPFPPFPLPQVRGRTEDKRQQAGAYTYAGLAGPDIARWTLGVSVNHDDSSALGEETRISPKLGVSLTPNAGTNIRAAALRTVRRSLIADQTVEPTQVAGFNQFFDDPVGTYARLYGVGLDQRISPQLFAGAEATKRDLEIPFVVAGSGARREASAAEERHRAYVYWAPTRSVALRGEYHIERLERPEILVPSGFDYLKLRTERIPVGIRWFHPVGLSLGATATWIAQDGDFFDTLTGTRSSDRDEFWQVDAQLRMQLPRRHGSVSVGVKNLFDTRFRFFEPVADNPTVYPERFVYLRLELAL